MKKSLLSLGLAALSFGTFAQTATNADIGGNLLSADKTGYTYNYGNTLHADADIDFAVVNWGENNAIHNAFGNADVVVGADAIATNMTEVAEDAGSIKFTIDGSAADAYAWISSRFGFNNGDPAGGENVVDYTLVANQKVRAMVYVVPAADNATGEVSEVKMLVAAAVDNGGFIPATAAVDMDYVNVTPNQWSEIEFTVDATIAGAGLTKGIGYSFRIVNESEVETDKNFTGEVYFEWIEFGSVVGSKEVGTGLEANSSAVGFEVYPNPAHNLVNFNYSVNGDVSVELSNSLGSVVSSTDGTSMNVAELPSGIYFATLKVNGAATAVQRVQVQ